MKAFQKNCSWEMIELPMGKKTIGCKWVFLVKYKSDGTIDRYKARLVAKDMHRLMELTIKKPLLL